MSVLTKKPILIIGASGLGKAALEIFKSHDSVIYGFLDDDYDIPGKTIDEIPLLGKSDDTDYLKLIGKECGFFVASDENPVRKSIVSKIIKSNQEMPLNAIHNQAVISQSASIGYGNFINVGTVIGAGAKISNHCLIHSTATLEYEVEIADLVQIGSGSIINPGVKIEEGAFVGSGVTIIAGITIGANANIGAGSVVIGNIKENETVFGNPARAVDVTNIGAKI